ncbi:MAG: hypothetical protein DWQ44_01110 [Bacteroidetes bacterium]|nr:MAG: hypothetical protein DWQ33_00575 [Bacteroidota bacterium]REK04983.1 MAG: hypothetical protein DWQ39_07145 [Bacteroidota bacterium]REK36513.1 MAG: hypothetical protein DWQ44_01110 [Bacteroidota bacterium]REK50879.1 MAG: hypothetical protein DWQ48_01970 [Bacteroidota bacterium]
MDVPSNGWADYVFDENYFLLPIKDLDKFIKENKHLPGVPSAAEVEDKGVDLLEMQTILLKKIEELNLYVIHLESRINELNKQ